MTLNLLARKEYFSDGNNTYYLRIENFSPEASYPKTWKVWDDLWDNYKGVAEQKYRELENEYVKKFKLDPKAQK
jgi:hypothetical protein